MLSTLCAICICVGLVSGYSTGPPSEACDAMTPSPYAHGNPQTGDCPYTLTMDKSTYSAGETITLTLQGGTFRGFFVQPRPSKDVYTTYGSFNSPAGTKNPCSDNGVGKNVGLTHNSKADKTSMVITWTAPSDYQGDIVFVYTVVQVKATFWVKQVSSTLTYKASTGPTQQPTQGPTTTQQQTAQGTINRDSECGVSKACFPADCTTDCDYLVTWKDVGTEIEFSLHRKAPQADYYIAIGFSADPKMGNDSVAECVSRQGMVEAQSSYNHIQKYNIPYNTGNFGVTKISGSLTDGILSCQFRRKKTYALASASLERRKRQLDAAEATFFDINLDWYLLVAHGVVGNDGSKSFHVMPPVISPDLADFQSLTVPEPFVPNPNTGGTVTKDSGCGGKVGCFQDCEGDACTFQLTWKDNGDQVDLTLTCKQAGNAYCAVGLSSDEKMGDDSVFACVSTNGVADVIVAYNLKSKDNEPLDDNKFGLTVTSASHVDGVLQCVFSRVKTAALAQSSSSRKKRAVADASTFFDMNSNWYLLYAYGTNINGNLNKHSVTPKISSQKADFQTTDDIGAEGVDKTQIRVHGILMVVAWMFNATLGIFMARFYKTVWPEGMEWCGDKRWFVLHRAMMISAFSLTVGGIVVIFIHVEGWAQIVGSGFQKSHPIIGLVVAGLALINPIMAFFRPHPGTPKRPYFKAGHTLVGVAAYICSIVNIFSGTMLPAAHMPVYIRYILYAFCGWSFLVEVCLHVYDCTKSSDKDEGTSPILGYNSKKGEAYELKSSTDRRRENKSPVDNVKVGFMAVHFLVMIGLTVAVCYILGTADGDH